jgi:hypothetical protein
LLDGEMLSGGPGVDVVLEMAAHPDSICSTFVRRNGRIFLLATEEVPNCRLTVETIALLEANERQETCF